MVAMAVTKHLFQFLSLVEPDFLFITDNDP
jgi:hypothetical protein